MPAALLLPELTRIPWVLDNENCGTGQYVLGAGECHYIAERAVDYAAEAAMESVSGSPSEGMPLVPLLRLSDLQQVCRPQVWAAEEVVMHDLRHDRTVVPAFLALHREVAVGSQHADHAASEERRNEGVVDELRRRRQPARVSSRREAATGHHLICCRFISDGQARARGATQRPMLFSPSVDAAKTRDRKSSSLPSCQRPSPMAASSRKRRDVTQYRITGFTHLRHRQRECAVDEHDAFVRIDSEHHRDRGLVVIVPVYASRQRDRLQWLRDGHEGGGIISTVPATALVSVRVLPWPLAHVPPVIVIGHDRAPPVRHA